MRRRRLHALAGLGGLPVIARLLEPWIWRDRARSAARLQAFALAEHNSQLDLQAAANACADPTRAAAYLRHARDEARHALALHHRANELLRELGAPPLPSPRADYEQLFAALGEPAFLAFVHRGEARAVARFAVHREGAERRGDARSAALFTALLADETRHAAYTRELLVALVGEAGARRAVRRAAAWEAWRTWRRLGRFASAWLYAALMTALYVALGPLAVVTRRLRPIRDGWR